MNPQSNRVSRILFNLFEDGLPDDLKDFFPKKYVKSLISSSIESKNLTPILNPHSEGLSRIHYSWLPQYIKRLPKAAQPYVIASLPKSEGRKLTKLMRRTSPDLNPSKEAKKFFLEILQMQVDKERPTHPDYLPYSPINPIGNLSKTQLIQLIDLLGLRDLAETMRTVVNNKLLQVIYSALTPEEQKYLNFCISQREKTTTNPIDLRKWNGDPAKLRNVIHRRGLIRLGKALAFQSEELRWHALHAVDTGRAAIIERNCWREKKEEISFEIAQQVVGLLRLIQQEESSG